MAPDLCRAKSKALARRHARMQPDPHQHHYRGSTRVVRANGMSLEGPDMKIDFHAWR